MPSVYDLFPELKSSIQEKALENQEGSSKENERKALNPDTHHYKPIKPDKKLIEIPPWMGD